jgi:hypothetical protein
MKTSIKLFALGMILLGFSANSFGQATANAPTSATIIAPITLTKTVDMNFGNVAVIGAGTVILVPEGTRSATGGVTLPLAFPGTITAAEFTVGGEGTNTYAITLPASDLTITRVSGAQTMTVGTFTSTPSATGVLTGGLQTLKVGATLNVGAAQVAGVYTNETGFAVTVNYN